MLPAPATVSQPDRPSVELGRLALGEHDRAHDDETGEHHPPEGDRGSDQPARARGGQRRDRPGEGRPEPAENCNQALPLRAGESLLLSPPRPTWRARLRGACREHACLWGRGLMGETGCFPHAVQADSSIGLTSRTRRSSVSWSNGAGQSM